jgi:pimeloyl-ACP methyl ester carboxylesterase
VRADGPRGTTRGPRLEIISALPVRRRYRPKLLFVHGICVGGWVWAEHFLPFFAAAGFEAHAVSLRGHGASEGREELRSATLADYTADLSAAIALLGGPVVLIGHSLGGAVVQNYLRLGGTAIAAALLASVPPHGLARAAVEMSVLRPALFQQVFLMAWWGVRHVDGALLAHALFSRDVPPARAAAFAALAQDEAPMVGLELQGWRPIAPLPWRAPPILVLGGLDDAFVSPLDIRLTAGWYRTRPTLLPRLAHALMLDTRWSDAAQALRAWLEALPVLRQPAAA